MVVVKAIGAGCARAGSGERVSCEQSRDVDGSRINAANVEIDIDSGAVAQDAQCEAGIGGIVGTLVVDNVGDFVAETSSFVFAKLLQRMLGQSGRAKVGGVEP